jgi:hypothetical protein
MHHYLKKKRLHRLWIFRARIFGLRVKTYEGLLVAENSLPAKISEG